MNNDSCYNSGKFRIPALPNSHFETMLEIISDREAVIEGCSGIIEYNDTTVSVNCRSMIITFGGFNFSIKALTADSVCVTGKITDINFSSR